MAKCDVGKHDLNETSAGSGSNLSVPVLRLFRNPYVLADPIGVTAYSEDFSWKPPLKPECIRTGTASGNRRNNPHPSQGFMVWRLPPGLKLCETTPHEDKVKNALSAQYKSTYRSDYLGIPEVSVLSSVAHFLSSAEMMMNLTARDTVKHISEVPQVPQVQTEMRCNYCTPVQRPELRGKISHAKAPKGIVPTVVPKHITNQEIMTPLTTYDRHFCGKSTDFASVLSSLKPEELQHFYKHLPGKEKMVLQTLLQKQNKNKFL